VADTKFKTWVLYDTASLSLENRCEAFRKALAGYLFWYYLYFVPQFTYFFGAHGMVDRSKLGPLWAPSLFFFIDSDLFLYSSLILIFVLSVIFFFNHLPRWGVLLLFILNVSFQNANPYILHEPQQLSSLFLLISAVFLPVYKKQVCDPFLWKTLFFALGVYYFFAGFKKCLDPLWMSGEALHDLIQWDYLGKSHALTTWLLDQKKLLFIFNGLTLFFEMSFVFVSFTRFFAVYWYIGLLFHISISAFLDVGTFTAIMFVWYALIYPRSFDEIHT
jgi:hypothetical protein